MSGGAGGGGGGGGGAPRLLAVNVVGVVEHPTSDATPYRIGRDGRPYVPAGDGGIVLGVDLGDGVFARDADHVSAGACLVHPDPAARLALVGLGCIGNAATVRTGDATGGQGVVVGKRGEQGRLVVRFAPAVLAALRPGDQVSVRAEGQGISRVAGGVRCANIVPALLERIMEHRNGHLAVGVRCQLPSKLMGNGIGRPVVQWCLDLQLDESTAQRYGAGALALGDLVALDDVDARWNIGYRRGWTSIGIVVHGGSPLPGHGPGITLIASGPPGSIEVRSDPEGHHGLTPELLGMPR